MKYLFLAGSSFLAIIAQMIAGDSFFLFNFLNLSLLLTAYWTVYRSRMQALFVGSLAGLMLDATLGWPLGYNGFGLTLAALIIGQCWKRFNTTDQPLMRFLILFAASCASSASMFTLFWIMQRAANRIAPVAALVQAVITAAAGFIFFSALDSYQRAQANKAQLE